MKKRELRLIFAVAVAACAVVLITARILVAREAKPPVGDFLPRAPGIAFAVLGDSDSQSYHDREWIAPGSAERGGPHRATTLQWTEVLARLRPDHVDQGPWGVWGASRTAVRLMDWFGVHGRAPRKEDFRFNFAFSGARCEALMEENLRQAPRLVRVMDEAPERWRGGVVLIRIGVCSFGFASHLDQLAADPAAPAIRRAMEEGVRYVREAVALIHSRHPETRVLLVGILNNADFPPYFDRWHSRAELDNIAAGLDWYDQSLRRLADADPRIAFFDDRAWFAARWGGRGADGLPAYRVLTLGPDWRIEHRSGDDVHSSVLADGHAGTVWNLLWAQSLVEALNASFGFDIPPIREGEILHFLEQELGLSP